VLKLGVIAGEASGDNLGAGLIEALREHEPDLRVYGVAGPKMQAAGCDSWAPASDLSVMGIFEILSHLPRLLRLRRELVKKFIADPPDVFIGIDSPDFNLGMERRLRKAGIKTMHYVSPTVWAWREKRVKTVARSVDTVLCLFPFEKSFYDDHGVSARFVGHPLADSIPMHSDRHAARSQLGLAHDVTLVAVLPGSRAGEITRLGPDFAATIADIRQIRPDWHFVAPMATAQLGRRFCEQLAASGVSDAVTLLDGQAQMAMTAADAVLLASGTATLEATLIKRPMVVAYRLAPVTYRLITMLGLMRVEQYSLPNLLAGKALVPEFMQDDITPAALATALIDQVENEQGRSHLESSFSMIHDLLRRHASQEAAQAVLSLVNG
jgi:lipid-A-disaccharide synthase